MGRGGCCPACGPRVGFSSSQRFRARSWPIGRFPQMEMVYMSGSCGDRSHLIRQVDGKFLGNGIATSLGITKESVMKITTQAVIATVLVVGFANIADARCRKSQVCDDYGNNCRVKD